MKVPRPILLEAVPMRASLIFLSLIPAMAQFSGLATTDDGSQLYFSTPLQLAGTTDENTYSKIFRYDGTGIHLVAQVARVATAGGIDLPDSNAYNLTSAYVSGNGTVTGYVGTADGGTYYVIQNKQQTTLQYPGSFTPYVLPYSCQISKNARYALCVTGGLHSDVDYSVFDLFGTQTPIYSPGCGLLTSPQIISGGQVLCETSLYSVSGSRATLPFPVPFAGPTPISDDGSTVAYVPQGSNGSSLYFGNVATGAQTLVYHDPQSRYIFPVALSHKGGVVLFYLGSGGGISQLAVVHADGTGFLQLTNDPANTGILSGDGSTAFVFTNSGLLKIDTMSGASTLIANGALIQSVQSGAVAGQGGAVAGSLSWIQGSGLADAAVAAQTFPLGTSLGGTQVTLNGTPVPLLSVSPGFVWFQIPWETGVGNATIAVVRPSSPSSPFMQTVPPLQILRVQPALASTLVLSQDFSAVNSPSNPAAPSGFVNLYLTGLGPVVTPQTDGVPAQASPLPSVVIPVTAAVQVISTTTAALNVAYAGLAPGMVGVYQVTVQMPSTVAHNPSHQVGTPAMVPVIVDSMAIPVNVWVTSNR
jgi:uncharacterized protein (TIGR03437 family)